MEAFKIKDFNLAFQKGIENLVKDAIISSTKSKKLKKKLKIRKAVQIIKHKIFVTDFLNNIFFINRANQELKMRIQMKKDYR